MTRHGKAPAISTPTKGSSSWIPEENSASWNSDSITAGSTQHSGEDEPFIEINFAGEIVKQIETMVESFRTGKVKKPQAIYKISQILATDERGDEQLKSDSLDQYASTLDSIEALANQLNKHGDQISNPILGKRKDDASGGSQWHEEPNRDNSNVTNPIDVDEFLEGISKENELDLGGNAGIPGDESGDDSEHESDSGLGNQGQSNKKQRIYESQMPQFSKEQWIWKLITNPSCNKTRETLDIFQRDPVTVKRWIRCAISTQQVSQTQNGIHSSKGRPLTLTLSSVLSMTIHSIDEGIGRLGSTEIQFVRPKPAAEVETSGQWTAVFNLIVKATSFLFPHRYDELRQYSDYFEELFSAKSTSIHPRLFKYDEAIRYKIGQGQKILLTDRQEFTWYYKSIVAPDGIGTETMSGGNKGGQKKSRKSGEKSDICHRFNGANRCSLATDKCKYKHICKKCKQCGHGRLECKVETTVWRVRKKTLVSQIQHVSRWR